MALPDSAMGEGRGSEREKQEGGEGWSQEGQERKVGGGRQEGRKKERKKERKIDFFFPIRLVMMYSAGIGPTCMFNDRVCQRARSLCEPANVSTAPECSCAHLAWKKGGETTHKNPPDRQFSAPLDGTAESPRSSKSPFFVHTPAVRQTFIKLCCLHLNE